MVEGKGETVKGGMGKLCELVARENLRAAAPHKAHLVKVSGVWMEGGGLGGCVCVCVCFLGGLGGRV